MTTIKVGTYNLADYAKRDARTRHEDQAHRDRIHQVIRELDVDVLAVQEVCGDGPPRLAELAEATGMDAFERQPWISDEDGEDGYVAIGAAGGDGEATYHVGLLWRDGITPVPGSFRSYGPEMWHALIMIDLDVGGRRLRCASYHGPPFGRERRVDEAERVVSALTRRNAPPALVGGDWNSVSADRVSTPGDGAVYAHPDPYAGQDWHPGLIYQCQWETDPSTGHPTRWHADRRPGETLWAAGMRDTSVLAGGPIQPTAGHHPADGMGCPRAIDTLRVTTDLTEHVVEHHVLDNPQTRAASDHLPVITTVTL